MPKCRIIPRKTPVSRLPGQRDCCPIVEVVKLQSQGEVKKYAKLVGGFNPLLKMGIFPK